jgi:hypothetical protein
LYSPSLGAEHCSSFGGRELGGVRHARCWGLPLRVCTRVPVYMFLRTHINRALLPASRPLFFVFFCESSLLRINQRHHHSLHFISRDTRLRAVSNPPCPAPSAEQRRHRAAAHRRELVTRMCTPKAVRGLSPASLSPAQVFLFPHTTSRCPPSPPPLFAPMRAPSATTLRP